MGVQNEYDDTTSDYLMHTTVSVIGNDHCNSILDEKRFLQDMVCAGYVDGGRDACKVRFKSCHGIQNVSYINCREIRVVHLCCMIQ